MTLEERIARLERLMAKMADALIRQGTDQDGNWGYPYFKAEINEIKKELVKQS